MKAIACKYFVLMSAVYLVFTNMIACGEQMYQANLRQDHTAAAIPEAAKDPASPQYGIHALGGWQEIPIRFKLDQTLNEKQIAGLKRAMESWEMAVGKKLFEESGFDTKKGDDFLNLDASLFDGTNGHYVDQDWAKTGKSSDVLATTVWEKTSWDTDLISTADIHFNMEYYSIGDTSDWGFEAEDGKIAVDMETLALHELGHLLGLSHVDEASDQYSIMLPSVYIGVGMYNRRLTLGDIERVQAIYGCEGDACNQGAILEALEQRALDGISNSQQASNLEASKGRGGAVRRAH